MIRIQVLQGFMQPTLLWILRRAFRGVQLIDLFAAFCWSCSLFR